MLILCVCLFDDGSWIDSGGPTRYKDRKLFGRTIIYLICNFFLCFVMYVI